MSLWINNKEKIAAIKDARNIGELLKAVRDNMFKRDLSELDKLKNGDKINAVIRCCNRDLKMPDEKVTLTRAEDGWYIGDGPDELSHNWMIVTWEQDKITR